MTARTFARAPAKRLALAITALSLALPAAADETLWRGNFIVGRQGAQLSPCRTGDRLRVDDRTPGRALEAAYQALALRPGRPIFVEFVGARVGDALRAERFERAQAEGPGCREELSDVRLRAFSMNPFVQLEMQAERTLVRRRPSETPEIFPGAQFEVREGVARYEGATASGALKLVLREQTCRDPLSGGLFAYTGVIDYAGERYSTCAYWGDLGHAVSLRGTTR